MYLVGFSINKLNPDIEWTKNRRERFLINQNILIPKSVDANVWEEECNINIMTSKEIVYNMPKWQNKEDLIRNTKYNICDKKRVLSTFVVFSEELGFDEYRESDLLDSFFLGYDIADEGATSGLSNCAYTPKDLEFCRENYNKYLNKHGLFDDIKIAHDFVDYTNEREVQHSPFYIYGIYTDKAI